MEAEWPHTDVKAEAGKGDLEDHARPKRVPSRKVFRQKYPDLQDCNVA